MAGGVLLAGLSVPVRDRAGEIATYMRDLFLDTVETLDSVLEIVSNWGIMC